jgi:hypothetical protein
MHRPETGRQQHFWKSWMFIDTDVFNNTSTTVGISQLYFRFSHFLHKHCAWQADARFTSQGVN